MNKTLIIAEKPSVALDISRALGGFTREGDYFESDQYVLAASIGHLLGLIAPNDPVKGKWSFTHLPVIPPQFALAPNDKKSAERLKLLVKLIKRKDVTALINACDAGREGELIFRYIVQHAGPAWNAASASACVTVCPFICRAVCHAHCTCASAAGIGPSCKAVA